MTIGERIREARKEKGWSQAQLAQELGVTQQLIAIYENGTRKPKMETIERIADALKVTSLQLMDFKQTLNIPDVNSAMYDFSNEETQQVIEMLSDFDKLNDKGKQKAVEYTHDLTQIDEYTKE